MLTSGLSFNAEQRLFLRITGLEDTKTGEVYPFVNDSDVPFYSAMPSSIVKSLKKDKLCKFGYNFCLLSDNIVFTDTRRESLGQLTADELANIRKEFDAIDTDGSGSITYEEIERYFAKELEDEIQTCRKITDRKVKTKPIARDTFEAEFTAKSAIFKHNMEAKVKQFYQMDLDNSRKIEFDEFLLHFGRIQLRRRQSL
jgi:Ca2+-binding EF-hand superfamily protein